MGREGAWRKALEIYYSLEQTGVRPDTAITNAAISACDKGMLLTIYIPVPAALGQHNTQLQQARCGQCTIIKLQTVPMPAHSAVGDNLTIMQSIRD